MSIQLLATFLGWCTIIHMGLLTLWTLALLVMPDVVHKTQKAFLPDDMNVEEFKLFMYKFLGFYKVTVLVFAFVPYIVLKIMG